LLKDPDMTNADMTNADMTNADMTEPDMTPRPRPAVSLALALATLLLPTAAVAGTDDGGDERALPSPGYVAASATGSSDQFVNLAVTAQAGRRLGATPIYARGQLGLGTAFDPEGSGQFIEARGGLEARSCRPSGALCFHGGLDVGYQISTWRGYDADERHTGLLLVPRVGGDVGGRHLRFAFGLDFRSWSRSSDASLPSEHETGLGLDLGLRYQF
jgi:hypothetical protein